MLSPRRGERIGATPTSSLQVASWRPLGSVATLRERRPGVWEVRAFVARDARGCSVQVSRTGRGTKKDAPCVAAEMTLRASTASVAREPVAEMRDFWAETIDEVIDGLLRVDAPVVLVRGSATT